MRTLPPGLVLIALVAACVPDTTDPNAGASIAFDAPVAPRLVPDEAIAPLRPDADRATPEQAALIERIVEAGDDFFQRQPDATVLDETELVFFSVGRIADLVDLYRQRVDNGDERLRPRLAWLYQRLGLFTAAIEQSDLARQNTPDAAEAWFVYGFVLGQASEGDRESLRVVRDAYARAVELDPAFVGPGGVTAASLRRQVSDLDGRPAPRH